MISQNNSNNTFMLMTEAFIQSDLHWIQGVHLICVRFTRLCSAKNEKSFIKMIYIQFKHDIAIFWLKRMVKSNISKPST